MGLISIKGETLYGLVTKTEETYQNISNAKSETNNLTNKYIYIYIIGYIHIMLDILSQYIRATNVSFKSYTNAQRITNKKLELMWVCKLIEETTEA